MIEVLWDAGDEPRTVREVYENLSADRDIAYTTVMTVLDRLARKGTVTRTKKGRAHSYRVRASRAAMTAEVMHDTLADISPRSRNNALVAFLDEASPEDLATLRAALERLED